MNHRPAPVWTGLLLLVLIFLPATVARAVTVSGQMFELQNNRLLTPADGEVIVSMNLAGGITELGRFSNGTYSVVVPDNARFELLFSRGGGVTNRLELRSVGTRNMQIDLPVPEFRPAPVCCQRRCRIFHRR